MAGLNVLAAIPGYGGFAARRQMMQDEDMQGLNSLLQAGQVASMAQQFGDRASLRDLAMQSGGDPGKLVQGLMQSGRINEAVQAAQAGETVRKIDQSRRAEQAITDYYRRPAASGSLSSLAQPGQFVGPMMQGEQPPAIPAQPVAQPASRKSALEQQIDQLNGIAEVLRTSGLVDQSLQFSAKAAELAKSLPKFTAQKLRNPDGSESLLAFSDAGEVRQTGMTGAADPTEAEKKLAALRRVYPGLTDQQLAPIAFGDRTPIQAGGSVVSLLQAMQEGAGGVPRGAAQSVPQGAPGIAPAPSVQAGMGMQPSGFPVVTPAEQLARDQRAGRLMVAEGGSASDLAQIDAALARPGLDGTQRAILRSERNRLAAGLGEQPQPAAQAAQPSPYAPAPRQPGTIVSSPSTKHIERLNDDVKEFQKSMRDTQIPTFEAQLQKVQSMIAKYKDDEDLPGYGVFVGSLPGALVSQEGKDLRQAVATLRNIELKQRSGAAVTDNELQRYLEELGTNRGMNASQLRKGIQGIRDRLDVLKAAEAAGTPEEVLAEYERRGGMRLRGGAGAGGGAATAGGFRVLR